MRDLLPAEADHEVRPAGFTRGVRHGRARGQDRSHVRHAPARAPGRRGDREAVRCEQAGVRALPADVQLRLRPRVLHLRARPQRVTDQGGEDDLRLGWPGPARPDIQLLARRRSRRDDGARERPAGLTGRLRLARDRERGGRLLAGRLHGEHQRCLPRPGAAGRVLSGPSAPAVHAHAGRVQAGVLHQPGRLARAPGQRRHRQGRALLPGRGEVRLSVRPEHRTDGDEPELAAPLLRAAEGRLVRADRVGSLFTLPHAAPARLRPRAEWTTWRTSTSWT